MSVIAHSIIGEVVAKSVAKAEIVVAKTTHDIKGDASGRSRVDTGAMRGGWTAQVGGLSGRVESGPDYTVYHEFGTSKMSAQAMAVPAAETARGPFYAAMGQVFKP